MHKSQATMEEVHLLYNLKNVYMYKLCVFMYTHRHLLPLVHGWIKQSQLPGLTEQCYGHGSTTQYLIPYSLRMERSIYLIIYHSHANSCSLIYTASAGLATLLATRNRGFLLRVSLPILSTGLVGVALLPKTCAGLARDTPVETIFEKFSTLREK